MITVKRMVEYQKSFKNFIRYKISVKKKISKPLEIGGEKEGAERSGRSGLIDRGGEDGRSNIP